MSDEPKEQTAIEITDDLIVQKSIVDAMIKALNESPVKNRARNLAITKLEEARMWMSEALRLE